MADDFDVYKPQDTAPIVMLPGYNQATGDSVTVIVHNHKTRLKFAGGYMLIGFGAFLALRQAKQSSGSRLPRDAYDVLFWFWQHLRVQNIVTNYTYGRIATELGVDASRVGKMVLALEAADCLQREAKCIRLNPNHCFFGNHTQQNDAIQEWNRGRLRLAQARQSKTG
jgi:hypothetical protein